MSYVNGISIEPLHFGEPPYFLVTVCNTRSCGILRFSEELVLTMRREGDDVAFVNCCEVSCGESWTWEAEDQDMFNADHPGLLELVRGEILSWREAA